LIRGVATFKGTIRLKEEKTEGHLAEKKRLSGKGDHNENLRRDARMSEEGGKERERGGDELSQGKLLRVMTWEIKSKREIPLSESTVSKIRCLLTNVIRKGQKRKPPKVCKELRK